MQTHRVLLLLIILALASSGNISAFARTSTAQDPIPSKLGPSIDVMWSVIPANIVSDNFGKKVGREFYAIDVVVGNNSGDSFLVTGIEFNLVGGSQSGAKILVTSSDIPLVLASGDKRIRVCQHSFRGNLLVNRNTQIRTIAFLPRKVMEFRDNKKNADEPREVARRLRDVTLVANRLKDPERLVFTSSAK